MRKQNRTRYLHFLRKSTPYFVLSFLPSSCKILSSPRLHQPQSSPVAVSWLTGGESEKLLVAAAQEGRPAASRSRLFAGEPPASPLTSCERCNLAIQTTSSLIVSTKDEILQFQAKQTFNSRPTMPSPKSITLTNLLSKAPHACNQFRIKSNAFFRLNTHHNFRQEQTTSY